MTISNSKYYNDLLKVNYKVTDNILVGYCQVHRVTSSYLRSSLEPLKVNLWGDTLLLENTNFLYSFQKYEHFTSVIEKYK